MLTREPERISVDEYRRRYCGGALAALVRRRAHRDSAVLFGQAWAQVGPKDLPAPEPEYRFARPRMFRFDWAWPGAKVAVECDGGRWAPGGGRHGSDEDREKLNIAAARGWSVLRYSPKQLRESPAQCVEQAAAMVRERMA